MSLGTAKRSSPVSDSKSIEYSGAPPSPYTLRFRWSLGQRVPYPGPLWAHEQRLVWATGGVATVEVWWPDVTLRRDRGRAAMRRDVVVAPVTTPPYCRVYLLLVSPSLPRRGPGLVRVFSWSRTQVVTQNVSSVSLEVLTFFLSPG